MLKEEQGWWEHLKSKWKYLKEITSFIGGVLGVFAPIPLPYSQSESLSLIWSAGKGIIFFIAFNASYKYLFIPPPKKYSTVPEQLSAFDNAIVNAGYNFCSTSTKEFAVWESPTFQYYLHLNNLKVFSKKAVGSTEIKFSNEPQHKDEFLNNCKQIIKYYGNASENTILKEFNAIRFLIQPEHVYREKEKEIKAFISVQAIGAIYCVPIIRERLMDLLNNEEKDALDNFSEKLKQSIEEEYALMSRVDRFRVRRQKNNPYSHRIPDFLIIDAYANSKNSSIWWFEGSEPKHDENKTYISDAQKCFSIIARVVSDHWSDVVWNKYDSNLFEKVPIFTKPPQDPRNIFFTQKYYKDWLNLISNSNKYPQLKKWFEDEEEILKNIIKNNNIKRMLDIGCGWGRFIKIALDNGVEYCVGIDIAPSVIDEAKKELDEFKDKVSLYYEDATKLWSFKDDSFDLVICTTNTFGNMKGDERKEAIKQIHRVLKKDGLFMLSVYRDTPKAMSLREDSYKEVGLHVYYDESDPKAILTQEGLYSRQFNQRELREYLSEFKELDWTPNDIAHIVIARK